MIPDVPSYSISVRLRRVTIEEGFVKVPVNELVMQPEPAEDGTYRLDTEKMFAEAVRLGERLDTWQVEEREVTLHPVQGPPPGTPEYDRARNSPGDG